MLNYASSNFVSGLGPLATVRSVQGRTVSAGPYGQCKPHRQFQGRTPNVVLHAQKPCIQWGVVWPQQGRSMLGSGAVRPMPVRSLQGRSIQGRPAKCKAVRPLQRRLLQAKPSAQCRTVRSMQNPPLDECRTPNARPHANFKAVCFVQRAPSRAVCSMQSRAINAGPNAQCRAVRKAVRSMPGRTECRAVRTTRGRKLNCRAVSSMQRRTINCRAARTMQGRLPNAGTYDASPCAQ